VPFLAYDVEIRKVICSTNALESLNARYRRAICAPEGTTRPSSPRSSVSTWPLDPSGRGLERMGHPLEAGAERHRLRRPTHTRHHQPV